MVKGSSNILQITDSKSRENRMKIQKIPVELELSEDSK